MLEALAARSPAEGAADKSADFPAWQLPPVDTVLIIAVSQRFALSGGSAHTVAPHEQLVDFVGHCRRGHINCNRACDGGGGEAQR